MKSGRFRADFMKSGRFQVKSSRFHVKSAGFCADFMKSSRFCVKSGGFHVKSVEFYFMEYATKDPTIARNGKAYVSRSYLFTWPKALMRLVNEF